MKFTNFRNKKILITGHTGFKGFWMTLCLLNLGAKIIGVSLKPNNYQKKLLKYFTTKQVKNFFFNIENYNKLKKVIISNQPDFIFHLAAQPIVSVSFKEPLKTWNTNVIGTGNILNSIRLLTKKCYVLIVTSDKCYEIKKKNKIQYFKESDSLGGKDPYSASKAATEIIFKSYFESFLKYKKNISISSVRAGNIIGGGDWSKNRIIPDCAKSWIKKEIVILRNPYAVRPWQHVLDAINGYLTLANQLSKTKKFNGQSFNFGPEKNSIKTVKELCTKFKYFWSETPGFKIKNEDPYLETKILALNITKAKKNLKWRPILSFEKSLNLTADWYKNFDKDQNLLELYLKQINYFQKLCKIKK